MARKRGEYQKRKKRQELAKDIFAILTILFITFIMIWSIINDAVAMRRIRQDSLKDYTGSYTCKLKRTYGKHRHFYYQISLGNGDSLYLPAAQCENPQALEAQQPLTFQYSEDVRASVFRASYSVLSIETADGEVSLLDLETSRAASVRRIWVMSILLFIWCGIFGGCFAFVFYWTHLSKLRKAKQKKKE